MDLEQVLGFDGHFLIVSKMDRNLNMKIIAFTYIAFTLFSATLIVKYLSAKRPFFKSFDLYLKQILSVLTEQSVQVASPIRIFLVLLCLV